MRLDREQLKGLTLKIAAAEFGTRPFKRSELLAAVVRSLKREGWWEEADNTTTKSAAQRNRGWSLVDWAVSDLGREDRLKHPERDQWRLPARMWNVIPHAAPEASAPRNGAMPSAALIRERLRRLERVTGVVGGKPVALEALGRETLYAEE